VKKINCILTSTLIIISLYSCRKIENYSEIPEISFNNIFVTDSVDVLNNRTKVVELSFIVIDGNGDIGLKESDTIGPYNKDSIYYYNLFIKEFEKIGDNFYEVSNKFPRNYRVPYLTPEGQNKNLKANIKVNIEYSYNDRNPLPFNIFKYEFFLVDRQLQHSNIDTSSTIFF